MMKMHTIRRIAVGALIVVGMSATAALSDDTITDTHLKAARQAMSAIKITDPYDQILPNVAQQMKSQMIQNSPNYENDINAIVDSEALKLAPRRLDLEKEAAMIYAKAFTEEELKQIAAFYETPAGKKLLKDGPIAIRELSKAGSIWANGITRDLQKASDDQLQKKIAADTPKATQP